MFIATYFFCAVALLIFACLVFRYLVRRDYRLRGRLSPLASILQLLVFLGYFCFPYLYNPPEWSYFWRLSLSPVPTRQLIGLVLIGLGFVIAFATMFWFGMSRAFGVRVAGLATTGPYRISRNPQVLGGYLLVLGTFIQWPSIYAFGWLLMYALILHWMVLTEEEHLLRVFGQEYETYCALVPRYLLRRRK